jgi:hypothetical protein
MAANAAGEKLPPLIIFKSKNVWDSWMAPAGEEYPERTCCDQKWLDGSRNLQKLLYKKLHTKYSP